MELELRKLKGQDVFGILRLLSKLGVKDLVLEIYGDKNVEVSTSDDVKDLVRGRGAKLVGVIIEALTEKLPDMQDDLNAFLADLTETDVATIIDLDFEEYMDLILAFFKKEELKSFFQRASSSLSTGNTNSKTSSSKDTAM